MGDELYPWYNLLANFSLRIRLNESVTEVIDFGGESHAVDGAYVLLTYYFGFSLFFFFFFYLYGDQSVCIYCISLYLMYLM